MRPPASVEMIVVGEGEWATAVPARKENVQDVPGSATLTFMVHLDLQPELEARLTSQAQARGLALDRYLADLLAAQARQSKPERSPSAAEAVAQIRQLRQGLHLDGLTIKDLIDEGRR